MNTLAEAVNGAMSEKEFAQLVVDLAQFKGWKVYRTWNSLHSPAGYPDLTMTRNGRIIFAELKTEKGKVSASQQAWLDKLGECEGVACVLWRPSHWEAVEVMLS